MPVKSVSIKLDKTRYLRFAMPNLCTLEDELGISLPQLTAGLNPKDMRFGYVCKLIWTGLLEFDEEGNPKAENLTERKVRMLLKPSDLEEYATKIAEAVNEALFKEDSKNETRPTQNQKSGTSKAT